MSTNEDPIIAGVGTSDLPALALSVARLDVWTPIASGMLWSFYAMNLLYDAFEAFMLLDSECYEAFDHYEAMTLCLLWCSLTPAFPN